VGRFPLALQRAAADEPSAFDVEEVGEVAFDADLEVDLHVLRAVVDELVVLVDAVAHRAVEAEVHAGGGNPTVGSQEAGVRELESGGERFDGRTVQQDGRHPTELEPVAGHQAGVRGEIALGLGTRHSAIEVTDHNLVVGVDDDHRRANLYLHR